jgi:hypothetical protein
LVQAALHVDASDFFRLSRQLDNLPSAIKAKVIRRALRRMQTMGRTRVVRLAAKRIKIPQKHIRERTTLPYGDGQSREIVVRSNWIRLGKLGARQGVRGALVRGRKSIRGSFVLQAGAGGAGVFKRVGKARYPIRELYGPNPANDIATSPEPYQQLLNELIADELGNRMLHELSRILPD